MSIYAITPPKTINLDLGKDAEGNTVREEYSFKKFITRVLLNLPEWNKGWKAIKSAIEISDALKGATGGPFDLSDTAFDMLKNAAENPSQPLGMSPIALQQMGAYFLAIIEAPEK